MKSRMTGFLVVAWIVPAVIAGALGWKGIWGTGSAFGDYLVPFPTAGGMLHVPGIAACLLLLWLREQRREPFAGLSRPILLGMSLAGMTLLVDMNDVFMAISTDAAPPQGGGMLTENPLGLFLLSDSLLAQFWLAPNESQMRSAGWVLVMLLAVIAPPLLVGGVLYSNAPLSKYPLLPGTARQGPARSDEVLTVYSTMGFVPQELEATLSRDLTFALPPEMHVNAEDQAVYFFDSLQAAREARLGAAMLTWCRYEDGTPSRWMGGEGDCFSDHLSFGERIEQLRDSVDPALSPEVRRYAVLRKGCEGITLQPDANVSSIAAQRMCFNLARMREDLMASAELTELDRQALSE